MAERATHHSLIALLLRTPVALLMVHIVWHPHPHVEDGDHYKLGRVLRVMDDLKNDTRSLTVD